MADFHHLGWLRKQDGDEARDVAACSICGRSHRVAPAQVGVYGSQISEWIRSELGPEMHAAHFEEMRFCAQCVAAIVSAALVDPDAE